MTTRYLNKSIKCFLFRWDWSWAGAICTYGAGSPELPRPKIRLCGRSSSEKSTTTTRRRRTSIPGWPRASWTESENMNKSLALDNFGRRLYYKTFLKIAQAGGGGKCGSLVFVYFLSHKHCLRPLGYCNPLPVLWNFTDFLIYGIGANSRSPML